MRYFICADNTVSVSLTRYNQDENQRFSQQVGVGAFRIHIMCIDAILDASCNHVVTRSI